MKSHLNAIGLWLALKAPQNLPQHDQYLVMRILLDYTIVLTVSISPDEDHMSLQYWIYSYKYVVKKSLSNFQVIK